MSVQSLYIDICFSQGFWLSCWVKMHSTAAVALFTAFFLHTIGSNTLSDPFFSFVSVLQNCSLYWESTSRSPGTPEFYARALTGSSKSWANAWTASCSRLGIERPQGVRCPASATLASPAPGRSLGSDSRKWYSFRVSLQQIWVQNIHWNQNFSRFVIGTIYLIRHYSLDRFAVFWQFWIAVLLLSLCQQVYVSTPGGSSFEYVVFAFCHLFLPRKGFPHSENKLINSPVPNFSLPPHLYFFLSVYSHLFSTPLHPFHSVISLSVHLFFPSSSPPDPSSSISCSRAAHASYSFSLSLLSFITSFSTSDFSSALMPSLIPYWSGCCSLLVAASSVFPSSNRGQGLLSFFEAPQLFLCC